MNACGNSASSPQMPVQLPNDSTNVGGTQDVGGIEDSEGSAEQQKLLELINDYRKQYGLGAVELSDELSQAMTEHAAAMDEAQDIFHSDGGGGTMENVAQGQKSAEEVFEDWKNSPGHDANMRLEGITEIGVGHVGDSWALNGR